MVVDASYVAAMLFPDEMSPESELASLKLLAPGLLHYELVNALKMTVKRKRFEERKAIGLLQDFIALPITYSNPPYNQVLGVAIEFDISAYDAAYVVLAKEKKVPLLTLDKKLESLAGH